MLSDNIVTNEFENLHSQQTHHGKSPMTSAKYVNIPAQTMQRQQLHKMPPSGTLDNQLVSNIEDIELKNHKQTLMPTLESINSLRRLMDDDEHAEENQQTSVVKTGSGKTKKSSKSHGHHRAGDPSPRPHTSNSERTKSQPLQQHNVKTINNNCNKQDLCKVANAGSPLTQKIQVSRSRFTCPRVSVYTESYREYRPCTCDHEVNNNYNNNINKIVGERKDSKNEARRRSEVVVDRLDSRSGLPPPPQFDRIAGEKYEKYVNELTNKLMSFDSFDCRV
jgi:hypothetical protein